MAARIPTDDEKCESLMSEELTLYHEATDLFMFESCGIMVGLYQDAMTMNFDPIQKALQQATSKASADLVILAVYRQLHDGALKAPSEAARTSAAEMMRTLDSKVAAIASVVVPTGFTAAGFRGIITGLMLLVRPKYAFKTFSSLPEGVIWCHERSRLRNDFGAKHRFESTLRQQMDRQDRLRTRAMGRTG